jgi:tRNA-2-methylthio-N6-dimethylallyladenosine synthase
MARTVFLTTFGCQMNDLDSELVRAALVKAGYEIVHRLREADVILFNTCSVRQHAEDKVYSALGRLKHRKETRPGTIIGILGCMAQKDGAMIFRRAPWVDLVVGPGQLGQLVDLLDAIASGQRTQVLEIALPRKGLPQAEVARSFAAFDPPRDPAVRLLRQQAMVRIMRGCDKFCTFCVVPSVRGPEQSRPARQIEAEVRSLVDQGCVEVTLLGQTVNSYLDRSEGRQLRLSDLLYRLAAIPGLRRIKFVTNHPKHMTDDLLQAVRDLPTVCPYLHVPAQSGSNRILQRMRRGYTVEEYREMIARIRETIPEAAITSDFIVGFCGETEEDFQQTVELVRWARFKNSFIFKYSPRPGTKAVELYEDDVPENVKRERNHRLLAEQNQISLEQNLAFIRRRVEVLVEGVSKRERQRERHEAVERSDVLAREPAVLTVQKIAADEPGRISPDQISEKALEPRSQSGVAGSEAGNRTSEAFPLQLTGRTVCDRIVVFPGSAEWIGRFLLVEVEKVSPVTLFGRVVAESLTRQ